MTGSKRGLTLVELLVVIAIVAILMALLLPAVQAARESARRLQCGNKVRQLAGGLIHHQAYQGHFPAGVVTSAQGGKMNVWGEAASTTATARGWSWMVAILPHIELQSLRDRWRDDASVMINNSVARVDVPLFYCPSRRTGVRDFERPIMLAGWRSGGTDYGGCIGGNNAFLNNKTPPCNHELNQSDIVSYGRIGTTLGILYHNSAVTPAHIRDGMSNTLLAGEMQRLAGDANTPGTEPVCYRTSQDGWAAGGVATLFNTYFGPLDTAQPGGMNNRFYESPGSDHAGGANFAMADGSAHFISEHIDNRILMALGTCAGGDLGSLP